jgi:hypothetical protein
MEVKAIITLEEVGLKRVGKSKLEGDLDDSGKLA